MDLDGMDLAFLYPTMAFFLPEVPDLELQTVLCRAYNDWLAEHCKADPELDFSFCMDVTAVDHLPLGAEPRFAVVYHLYSLETGKRLRVKTGVPEEDPVVDTAVDVWKSTDWFEREVYDMFGIRFEGHPNMKRILCHADFRGHALRKDYPADLRWRLLRPDDLLDEISSEEMQRIRSRVSHPISE